MANSPWQSLRVKVFWPSGVQFRCFKLCFAQSGHIVIREHCIAWWLARDQNPTFLWFDQSTTVLLMQGVMYFQFPCCHGVDVLRTRSHNGDDRFHHTCMLPFHTDCPPSFSLCLRPISYGFHPRGDFSFQSANSALASFASCCSLSLSSSIHFTLSLRVASSAAGAKAAVTAAVTSSVEKGAGRDERAVTIALVTARPCSHSFADRLAGLVQSLLRVPPRQNFQQVSSQKWVKSGDHDS